MQISGDEQAVGIQSTRLPASDQFPMSKEHAWKWGSGFTLAIPFQAQYAIFQAPVKNEHPEQTPRANIRHGPWTKGQQDGERWERNSNKDKNS